jgi:hypothetical protein
MNTDQCVQNIIYRTGRLCRTRLCLKCAPTGLTLATVLYAASLAIQPRYYTTPKPTTQGLYARGHSMHTKMHLERPVFYYYQAMSKCSRRN